MRLHPGCAQGQGQGQRSRDTDTFLITRKSLLLPQTGLDRHQTCTRLATVDGRAFKFYTEIVKRITTTFIEPVYSRVVEFCVVLTSVTNLHDIAHFGPPVLAY